MEMMIRTRNPYFRLVDDLLNETRPSLGNLSEFENRSFTPALDVEESADAYTVHVNLPGIKLDDISVNIHDDVLTISAESAAERRDEDSRVVRRERRYGKFSRSLRFPTIDEWRRGGSQAGQWRPEHHAAEGGAGQAAADPGQGLG